MTQSNVATLHQEHQSQDMSAPYATHTANMLMSPQIMGQIQKFAEVMATGKSTVPKHLQGSMGDCMAVTMQAAQWGMNPFAVAQKTHLVNGALGYEAQLVNAVISSSRAITGRFKYEYGGDWSKQNSQDAWVRVGAVLAGDQDITWGEPVSLHTITTKNSPLWKTNPKQQAAYLAVKYWARLYCPDVILGVYTADELHEVQPREREINPQQRPSTSLKAKLEEPEDVEPEQSTGPAMPDFDEPAQSAADYTSALQTMIDGINECSSIDELNQWGADIAEFTEANPAADVASVRRAFGTKKKSLQEA
ncbi:RecT family recombinase [Marinobacterium litorale]|uniref:RecT family recombinase n=1 Tax=Marinobacterium litorale TaxID=404770 RepID=UPI0003FFCB95|nr:RecT family recombinase [Marinobacterium litorale]